MISHRNLHSHLQVKSEHLTGQSRSRRYLDVSQLNKVDSQGNFSVLRGNDNTYNLGCNFINSSPELETKTQRPVLPLERHVKRLQGNC